MGVFGAFERFYPAARARRFFCFFLKAARLRAVFLLRFFSGMAVSYRLEELRQCSRDATRCTSPWSSAARQAGHSAGVKGRGQPPRPRQVGDRVSSGR